jgi:GMP synthase-like glutamine amidotransferase
MKPVLVFIHVSCTSPGYIETLLQSQELPFELVCFSDDSIPEVDPRSASALVIMGGPGNVSEPTAWMHRELEVMREADQQGVPILGICLGAQLLCQTVGGSVRPGKGLEVGWHQVEVLDDARRYPGLQQVASSFEVFQWHAHVCDPPPAAQVLATSSCTPCQAFAIGPHLAMQFHPEMTAQTIRELIERYPEDLEQASPCVQNAQQILDDIHGKTRRAFEIADQLLIPWFEREVKQSNNSVG